MNSILMKLLQGMIANLLTNEMMDQAKAMIIDWICAMIEAGAAKTETKYDDAVAKVICDYLRGL